MKKSSLPSIFLVLLAALSLCCYVYLMAQKDTQSAQSEHARIMTPQVRQEQEDEVRKQGEHLLELAVIKKVMSSVRRLLPAAVH